MKRFTKLIIPLLIALILAIGIPLEALAATTADVTITATPEYLALTVTDGGTNTWAIGAIAESTTAWYSHDNAAPANPVTDAEGKITITNTGSISENINLHAHAFSGGVGWTIGAAVGADTVVIGAFKTTDTDKASMLKLTVADQEYLHDLASSAHTHGGLYLDTGTFTDGAAKSTTITYTCVKHT